MERISRKGASRASQSNTATAASKKEIDERRLRKLKVYLRSVSYNSCDGLPKFPTLPDLYEDTILSEEFPCDTMKLSNRHHCAPTPFLIACCFNRRYPLNARKRAGNVRSRPPVKQGSEKTMSFAGEKKTLCTSGDSVSSVQTTNQGKVSKSGVTLKLRVDPTMERQIATETTKIVGQDTCAGNGKKGDRECPKDCKTSIVKITIENKEQETAKHNNDVSLPGGLFGGKTGKVESCGAIKKNTREDDDVSSERKTSEANKLNTDKTTVGRMGEITEARQDHVCERHEEDGLAKNKHDERDEKEREVSDDLESCSTKEESRAANKRNNKCVCSGMTESNDQSSCHTSFVKINLDDSTIKFEGLEIENETGKASQTATVTSKKVNIKPEVDQICAYPKVENEKKSTERQKDDITSSISGDPFRRTSSRLATSCNRHRTQPQDKERNVQRKAVKCAEKMKLKMGENANTRLRSRAVIKQPGYENRHTKGHQTRGK